MLIQFSVENYRSIKTEQILSLVKNSASEMPDNFFHPNSPNTPELLTTAVIYGANASGKSNVLKAFACMIDIVKHSFQKPIDEPIDVEPFKFDPKTRYQPTTFELVFVVNLPVDGEIKPVRAEYGFSLDKNQVYEEWLSVYPKGREQTWFHRLFDDETGEYTWQESSHFKGSKAIWKDNTRKDQLFLSTAVALNSEQLQPIYFKLMTEIHIIAEDRIGDRISKDICKEHANAKKLVISLLQQANIDVVDIVFKNRNNIQLSIPDFVPEKYRKEILEDFQNDVDVFFVYQDNQGQMVEINLTEESDGTQKIFEFSIFLFTTLKMGYTLVIDEFNKSLHPDLVRFLVKMFNSENNTGHGQLIFTTHETSVLRKDLLRRDQIWFCEKNQQKETIVYPLTDFSPRKSDREDLEEAYLHGRYGGKPNIQAFVFPKGVTNE